MADRSSKLGIVAVAVVVVLGGAGIAGWLLWWTPKQERETAQQHVRAWETRWDLARRCLLGDPPLAIDPGDALALAELDTGSLHSNASDCTRVVGGLVRPDGAASPIEAIEEAWAGVQASIPALANAYAMRISADVDDIDRRVVDLGVAISALDGAHDTLRAAASMPAPVRGGTATLARLPEPAPVVADGAPVTALGAQISAGAIRAQRFAEAAVEIRIGPADQVVVDHYPLGAILAQPDGSWVVAATQVIGTDGQPHAVIGAMPTAAAIDPSKATVVMSDADWVPIVALGKGAQRTVLLEREAPPDGFVDRAAVPGLSGLYRAVSTNGGASWSHARASDLPEGLTVDGWQDDPETGVVDVVFRTGRLRGSVAQDETLEDGREELALYRFDGARPSELPAPVRPAYFPGFAPTCRRGGTLWWPSVGGVERFAAGAVALIPAEVSRVIDCTASAALVEGDGMPVQYHRCTAAGCQLAFRGSTYAYGRAAMLDDGLVVYAAGRGLVIALWTENVAEPRYFKLPRPMSLHALVVWGGVPHAVLVRHDDEQRALFTVPLVGQ